MESEQALLLLLDFEDLFELFHPGAFSVDDRPESVNKFRLFHIVNPIMFQESRKDTAYHGSSPDTQGFSLPARNNSCQLSSFFCRAR